MKLSEYLIEAVARRKEVKYGIGMTSCKTITELLNLIAEKTNKVEKPKYITNNRMFGSDSEYLTKTMELSEGRMTVMVEKFKDGLHRPVEHYQLHIVKPDQMVGYVLDLYDIPLKGERTEGKIKWNVKGGTSIVVWDLEKMVPVKSFDNFDNAQKKLEIIEMI